MNIEQYISNDKSVKQLDENHLEMQGKKSDIKSRNPCPARCRTTEICYAMAFFNAKSTKERLQCDPSTCQWTTQRDEVMSKGWVVVDGEVTFFQNVYSLTI